MTAVLKVNCPSIRKRLEEAGINLCACCEFDGAVWLVKHTNIDSVHGEGYEFEEKGLFKVEEVLSDFEKENPYTDFGYDVEGFIEFCKKGS